MGSGAGKASYTYDNVPDQTGKVVLITGANTGLGLALVKDYVQKTGARKVILACRNESKAQAALAEVADQRACFLQLDLADLEDIKQAPSRLLALGVDAIDALVLNAGCLNKTKELTKQNHERTFGVCHLGHFALTCQLWPLLAPDARVVSVASVGHTWTSTGIDVEDLDWEQRKYHQFEAYFQAKLCNVYFASELARRLEAAGSKVTVTSNSPGFGKSELYRDPPGWAKVFFALGLVGWEDCAKLSLNTLRAATDPELPNGAYLSPAKRDFYGPPVVKPPSKRAQDKRIAGQLWAKSEELCGMKFEVA